MATANLFDAAQLLKFEKGNVVETGKTGLNNDALLTIRWEVAIGAIESCEEWLDKERRTLRDFTVEFKYYDGIYRTIKVETGAISGRDRKGGFVQHTIAKGWITDLVDDGDPTDVDWTEARWERPSSTFLGNTSSAKDPAGDAIANTVSDSPQRFIFVRFPYVAPESANAVAVSFTQSTYTGVSVEGQSIAGTWHRVGAYIIKQDDGTCDLVLHLANPQYTLEAYRDYLTTQYRGVTYLWGVPKDLAQTIIDAWKSVTPDTEQIGRSASASERSDGLVDIVLITNPLTKDNLTADLKSACDTTVTYHFAWGYTKAELGTFMASHNGALGSGMTRTMTVRDRSDGLYDAIITETTLVYDASKHLFTVDLVAGTGIVRTRVNGWNVSKTILEAVKADYEVATEGSQASFEVRREDDCTFDYVGEIVVATAIQRTLEAAPSGSGIREKVHTSRHMKSDDLTTMESSIRSGPRKRVQINADVTDDDTTVVSVKETEVERNIGQINDSGDGIVITAMTGANVDAADLASLITSAARKRHSVSFSGNDDGTFAYNILQQELQKVTESAAATGTGLDVTAYTGKNVDAADIATLVGLLATAPREHLSLELGANDDGTLNYNATVRTVVEAEAELPVVGDGEQITAYAGKNVSEANLAAILTSVARHRYSVSLSGNDDDTFDYHIIDKEVQEVETSMDAGVGGVAVKTFRGQNVDVGDLVGVLASGPRVRVSIDLSANDDGTVNYSATQHTVQKAQAELTATGGEEEITAMAGRNVDADDLVGLIATAARHRISLQLTANDDDTYSYAISDTTVPKVEETMVAAGTGVVVTAFHGQNVDAADVVGLLTAAPRKRISLDLSANVDGTLNYSASQQVVNRTIGSMTVTGAGQTITAKSGRNVDHADLMGVLTTVARQRLSLQLSGNDDDTFDYHLVDHTVQKVIDTMDSTGTGVSINVYRGRNVDAAELTGILTTDIRTQITASLDANDEDGTFNYHAVKVTFPEVQDNVTIANGGTVGVRQKMYFGEQVTVEDFKTLFDGFTATDVIAYDVQMNITQGGAINYIIREQEVQKGAAQVVIPIGDTTGTGLEIKAGHIASLADIAALATEYPSAARKSADIRIVPLEAGGYSFNVIERETQERTVELDNLGSIGRPETVTLGRGLESLTFAAPPSQGDELSLRAVGINDDGTITYELRSAKSAPVNSSVSGGTYGTRRSEDITIGTTTDPANFTPQEGEGMFLEQWGLDDRGTKAYRRVRLTKTALTKSGILLDKTLPIAERFGSAKTATVFENVKPDDLPTPSGDYYFYSQLQIDDHGLMSGVLVDVVYNALPQVVTLPVGDITQFARHYSSNGLLYRDTTYNIEWLISNNGGSLLSWLDGSLTTSSLDRMDVEGNILWRAIRVTIETEGTVQDL